MVKKGKTLGAGVRSRKGTKKQPLVPGSFNLLIHVFRIFKSHWQVLGGIVIVYAILNIIFASGLSSVINNFSIIKEELALERSISSAFSGLSSLITGGASSDSASLAQSFLLILQSLVIIWALRHLMAKKDFGVKDAYYKSMYPLVPFLLIVILIIIQLLPITLGTGVASLVSSALGGSDSVTLLIFLALLPLLAWSVYMLSSSVFALYIVTLPDMQPRQALRSAKKLVQSRRLKIIRRLLFLPLFMLLVFGVVMLPLILFINVLVVPVFYALSMLAILFTHTYLYSLYRGLLEE